jgi:hypothetical protein
LPPAATPASRTAALPPAPLKWIALAMLFGFGLLYLWHELIHAATRDRSADPFMRNLLLLAHLNCATPLLLLPPLQFSRRIRLRRPVFHCWAGRVELVGAAVAAVSATVLALTFDEVGRRPPLLISTLLWLGFALAVWFCPRRRRIAAHVRFVVRT